MKVDARTPQAFLIFMCLCIFRFIICPQAKVAASCPCPADVGRGVRSLSAFTYRAMCCVLNLLGAAQMVLLFFRNKWHFHSVVFLCFLFTRPPSTHGCVCSLCLLTCIENWWDAVRDGIIVSVFLSILIILFQFLFWMMTNHYYSSLNLRTFGNVRMFVHSPQRAI
jgi:hypothetical protein